jgi:hypothetical protein
MAHQPSEARDGETMSEPLGQSLHASSVPADAEAGAMLRRGYEGMRTREKSIATIDRRRLAEADDRLIDLYTSTNLLGDVQRGRARAGAVCRGP